MTLRDEIETLRGQIENLTADVRLNSHPIPPTFVTVSQRGQLRELLDQRTAELDTLRALTPSSRLSGNKGGSDVCGHLTTFSLLTRLLDRISMVWCSVWFRRRSSFYNYNPNLITSNPQILLRFVKAWVFPVYQCVFGLIFAYISQFNKTG